MTHIIFLLNSNALRVTWHGVQIWSTAYFYISWKLKRVFTFSKGCFKKKKRSCYRHYVWPAKVKIFTILPFIQKVCPPTLSSLLTGFGATVILQSWMQCQKNYAWNSPTNFHIPTIVLNVVARIRREFQKEKEGMVQTPLWFPPHPHLTYSSSKAYVHCYLTDPFPC